MLGSFTRRGALALIRSSSRVCLQGTWPESISSLRTDTGLPPSPLQRDDRNLAQSPEATRGECARTGKGVPVRSPAPSQIYSLYSVFVSRGFLFKVLEDKKKLTLSVEAAEETNSRETCLQHLPLKPRESSEGREDANRQPGGAE
ncbi:hypothetical protein CesoFtcFv8_025168 [Champsocephalus esox]|uniref:Uncharacterized protein n=1 Tax=Champsocephalus esox TaxID=159716 RepID=A0AAN8GBZ9_9TELE|nr:hypothetical protein CesoFtcFv8_025168 [Champsocephalus esox]